VGRGGDGGVGDAREFGRVKLRRREPPPDLDNPSEGLFTLKANRPPAKKTKTPLYPIWTENKAKLIERYLYYFVLITKHGTYIDGFAGPQDASRPDLWAARLVLENRPRWLRHFHLFELVPAKVTALETLKASQPLPDRAKHEPRRSITIYPGDFNTRVHELLQGGSIRPKEATFCLLDQRTFECRWASVKALAQHRSTGKKLELFYRLLRSLQASPTITALTRLSPRLVVG
jgi:hypothetical protein